MIVAFNRWDKRWPEGDPRGGQFMPKSGWSARSYSIDPSDGKPLPPRPGEVPIPEGNLRMYHQTGAADLDAIAEGGLEARQPTEGPWGVWASEAKTDARGRQKGFYGAVDEVPTVEFTVPADAYPYGPSYPLKRSVEPSEIIAVHLPWHRMARTILETPEYMAAVSSGELDYMLTDPLYDNDPTAQAVRWIKAQKGGGQVTASAFKYTPKTQPRDKNNQKWVKATGGSSAPTLPGLEDSRPYTVAAPELEVAGSLGMAMVSNDDDYMAAIFQNQLDKIEIESVRFEASASNGDLTINIFDKETDKKIGYANRSFELGYIGGIVVHNDYMTIDRDRQGNGIGTALTRTLNDFYLESGDVEAIKVQANIDVGGFTWARLGFDFDYDNTSIYDIIAIAEEINSYITNEDEKLPTDMDGDAPEAENLYNYTPADLAAIGWYPGASSWPGKAGMMNSSWHGIINMDGLLSDKATAVRHGEIDWVSPLPPKQDTEERSIDEAVRIAESLGMSSSVDAFAYNPNQERWPKGRPDGGRFKPTGAAGALPRITPESPQQATMSTNPYRDVHESADINCQKCVTAYELRRRGYDAVAGYGLGGRENSVGLNTWWQRNGNPIRPVTLRGANTPAKIMERMDLAGAGAGSRGYIEVQWRLGGRHVISWERTDDGLRLYDSQKGLEITPDMAGFWDNAVLNSFTRLDDAEYVGRAGPVSPDDLKGVDFPVVYPGNAVPSPSDVEWEIAGKVRGLSASAETGLSGDLRRFGPSAAPGQDEADEMKAYIASEEGVLVD